MKSKYGIPIFGVGNLILMLLTNKWRLQQRMGNNLRNTIPYISLFLFIIVSYLKCGPSTNYSLTFKFNFIHIIYASIVAYITSNDINFDTFRNKIKS